MSTTALIARTAPRYTAWAADAAMSGTPAACADGLHRLKRVLDVVVALVILCLVLPVLLLVALLVAVSSPGPIFFRQRRIGLNGTSFTLLKFRTMYNGTSSATHQAYCRALIKGTAEASGDTFKMRHDPRITRIGRLLRRSSLDEFPQLINVLKGDMSLVGPRPALPYEVEQYGPRELGRLSVVPGLTGLWQVSGRAALTFHQMIDLDLTYIERWSMWLDLEILAQTPLVVLTGRGAC